jgi:outer membrane biosynthesis protein TonB
VRAEGVTALAVAAFGLSFVGGMQLSSGSGGPSKRAAGTPTAAPLSLAQAEALPGIAATPAPERKPARAEPKRKAKPKPKPKPKPRTVVRVVTRAPAPVVRAAPAPTRAPAAPRAAPAPVATAAPRPSRTATPVPTFDDQGHPNSGSFDDGGG